MMKDKDFENMDETKVDETVVMNRPEGSADDGGEPEPEGKTPKVTVRPKDKAQRDIVAAVAKAREAGTVSSELSDEDVVGIVTPVVDTLYDAYEEDGTVPTREAFAEHCASEDIGNVVLGMSRDPFVKRRLGGKAVAAICAGCAVVAVLVGVWSVVGGQTQAAPDAGVSVSEPAGMYDDEDESQAGSESDTDEEDAETDESAQDTTGEEESADDPSADEGAATSAESDSTSGGSGSAAGGSASTSSGGSNSGGGSGSGSSSGGSSSSQSSHTHNWVPVTTTVHHDAQYQTVHHDAQYQTVHHDAVTERRSICNQCGADITGNESAHFKNSLLSGGNCGGCHDEYVTVQAAYDEQVLVSAAWDEQVLVSAAWDETVTTGYKCSTCGATK